MARPVCYACGRGLAYVNGKPVYSTYVDPLGNAHKLHKLCYEFGEYKSKEVTAQPVGELVQGCPGSYTKPKGVE